MTTRPARRAGVRRPLASRVAVRRRPSGSAGGKALLDAATTEIDMLPDWVANSWPLSRGGFLIQGHGRKRHGLAPLRAERLRMDGDPPAAEQATRCCPCGKGTCDDAVTITRATIEHRVLDG